MRSHGSQDRQIVGLCSTAQKDHVFGIGVQQKRHLAPCNFEFLLGDLAMLMNTGRVSIHFK